MIKQEKGGHWSKWTGFRSFIEVYGHVCAWWVYSKFQPLRNKTSSTTVREKTTEKRLDLWIPVRSEETGNHFHTFLHRSNLFVNEVASASKPYVCISNTKWLSDPFRPGLKRPAQPYRADLAHILVFIHNFGCSRSASESEKALLTG